MTRKKTTQEFIQECKAVHGEDKYDYSKVEYKNNKIKVCIICPEHGEFEQQPSHHLNGHGCNKCSYIFRSNNSRKTTKCFIKDAVNVHGNKFDYSKVEYTKSNEKVSIICSIHGVFEQTPNCHLRGDGCPKCKQSKGEFIISNCLNNINIQYETQKSFDGLKGLGGKPLKYDFYIPSIKILIEFDGIQHYEIIKHFGGADKFTRQQSNDQLKNDYARDNGYILIRIPFYRIDDIPDILNQLTQHKNE